MDPLDENTLDELARLICGDDGPVYRQGWELPKFLARAGWADVPDHDGAPRKEWVLERLCERRTRTEDIEHVILRLTDPREYLATPSGLEEAITRVNNLLVHEGYKVQLPGGRPRIVECDPVLGHPTDLAPVELKTTLADLIGDSELAVVLQSRLDEAQTCRSNGAHAATIILLGSLLEGVLITISRQRLPLDQSRGTDRLSLEKLIELAHDNKWIQADVRRFAHEVRSYRNLVHPWAEIRAGHAPDRDTVEMCWPVIIAALNDLSATADQSPTAVLEGR